jgi:hypothetical protein
LHSLSLSLPLSLALSLSLCLSLSHFKIIFLRFLPSIISFKLVVAFMAVSAMASAAAAEEEESLPSKKLLG